MDCSRYVLPRAGRFTSTDVNRGTKKKPEHHRQRRDVCAAHAGRRHDVWHDPAQPWFRLALADKDLMGTARSSGGCADVAELMRAVFAASNTTTRYTRATRSSACSARGADFVLPTSTTCCTTCP